MIDAEKQGNQPVNPINSLSEIPWIQNAIDIVGECDFPGQNFIVDIGADGVYLQSWYLERDTVTGKMEKQWTRPWLIKPYTSNSDIVRTAFKCIMTSMEHRIREWFTWRNRAIFQPHFEVEQLWNLCEDRADRSDV